LQTFDDVFTVLYPLLVEHMAVIFWYI